MQQLCGIRKLRKKKKRRQYILATTNVEMDEGKQNTCAIYVVIFGIYLFYIFLLLVAIHMYINSLKDEAKKKLGSHVFDIVGLVICIFPIVTLALFGLTTCVAICKDIDRCRKVVPVEIEEPASTVQLHQSWRSYFMHAWNNIE